MRRPREGHLAPQPPSTCDGPASAELRRLYDEGASAWPDLSLPLETFAVYAAARADGAAGGVAELRAADLFLACTCASGVDGALEAFERTHTSRIAVFLSRMRPSRELVEEVRQGLREKLFVGRGGAAPRITEYDGKGTLANWVRVVAVRAAIDLRRRRGETPMSDEREIADPAGRDPELGYIKRGYKKAFDEAFRIAVASIEPEQRDLLRMHFVEGLTLEQLAAKLGVHRATIARRIASGRDAIAEEARRLLGKELGATRAEVDSIVGLLRSRLDVSLADLLRAG